MEIRRLQSVRVARHKSCRDQDCATKCYREMREIATNACSLRRRIKRGSQRIGASSQVLDVVVDPVANCRDSRKTALKFPKLMLGKSHQLIRLAIPARIKVWNDLGRYCARYRFGNIVPFLNPMDQLDRRLVGHSERSCRSGKAVMPFFLERGERLLDLIDTVTSRILHSGRVETNSSPHRC